MLLVTSLAALVPASAHATFPGANGKIAFQRADDIWTMNPDGTDQVNLTNSPEREDAPAWSPDGNKIAFGVGPAQGPEQIWSMYADGSGRTKLSDGTRQSDWDPAWSPDGEKIIFASVTNDGSEGLWTMNPDGSGASVIADGFDDVGEPDWSPAGDRFAFWEYRDFTCGNNLYFVKTADLAFTNVSFVSPSSCAGPVVLSYDPSWAPDAQRIVFYGYDEAADVSSAFTVNPDGTGRQQIADGRQPAWSPDGTRIASVLSTGQIAIENDDGTNVTPLASGDKPAWQPLPSGSGADVLMTLTDAPDPIHVGQELHYTASAKNLVGPATATGVTLTVSLPASVYFVSATPTQGSCNLSAGVVTCNFGTLAKGASASVDIDVEPKAPPATITASATVSATETDPGAGNNTASTTTTVSPGGYPRPHGASPLRVVLVPAYRQCTDNATLTHGAPLSYPSCAAPALTSGSLTAGTPDANGKATNFTGYVRYGVVGEQPIDPSNGDQADVLLDAELTDVRKLSDLSDYTGQLSIDTALRITDQYSGAGGFTSATLGNLSLSATVPCAATADTATGGLCELHTSFDAIMPGVVKERTRAVWALDKVRVLDGGPDGSVATQPNTLFATQGVFVP